uniref:Uncharacterized protein n=1 Tax=Tanacetum cinerariifolium TaxID=118510 RepID=A0A699HEN3_TANCI|nr:hypothetical protein [Tanacetum cinerariifolium]
MEFKIITQQFCKPFVLLRGLNGLGKKVLQAMMIRKDPEAMTKKVLAPFFYGFGNGIKFLNISQITLHTITEFLTEEGNWLIFLREDCFDSDTRGIGGDVEWLIEIGKGEGHELGHGVFQGIKGSGCHLVPCKRGFFRRSIKGDAMWAYFWTNLWEKWDSMVVRARGWEAMWWIKKCFVLVEQGTDCGIVVLDWKELGVTGDEMGWPCNTHVEPLTVKVNLGMEKSATMVPNDPNQASPRITSVSATGRTKRGTLKVNLLISSGVLGMTLLHSRNWPLPTITGKGVMGAGLEASRAAMRGWMMLCVLPQSKRTLSVGSVLSRSKNSEAGSGSVSAGCSLSEISKNYGGLHAWPGCGGRGFGVGSKAVVAGVEFGFVVRAGVTGFGSGLGVENGERGGEEVFLLLTASNLGTGSASWWSVWAWVAVGLLGYGSYHLR